MKKPVALILALVVMTTPLFVSGQKPAKVQKLTEEQRIVHVLNRLGFGARPGDVERVKALGLENYINQQLNPENISDSVAENKVRDLNAMNMTTAELYEKYPQPGQLLRQLQQRGTLKGELRVNTDGVPTEMPKPPAEMPKDEAMERREMRREQPKNTKPTSSDPEENKEYREMIEKYYRENGYTFWPRRRERECRE